MPAPEIGTVMKDGTVFIGLSPVSGNMLFAMPKDFPLLMSESIATGRIEALNKDQTLGHNDWRLPTMKELKLLFENKEKGALSGTFNLAGTDFVGLQNSDAAGWYRSSEWGSISTKRCKLFKNGHENYILHTRSASVRLIREGGLPENADPSQLPFNAIRAVIRERQERLYKIARSRKQPQLKSP